MSLALVSYQPVCLRCGGRLRAVVWDQPSLLRHGWLGEPLDYRVTVRICERCGASRRSDVRAVAVRRVEGASH
jgi:ribosomal protein L40E